MTDGLNDVWSNDRAAPTDTTPKNLELEPPQSVTATRLDQLVNSPNCYIQIFQTQLFARSEDRTTNRSLEVKVQRAYRLRYWAIYLGGHLNLMSKWPEGILDGGHWERLHRDPRATLGWILGIAKEPRSMAVVPSPTC